MTEIDQLIQDAEKFSRKAGFSLSTISRKLFGDGTRIDKIKKGATAYSSTVARARGELTKLESELSGNPHEYSKQEPCQVEVGDAT